MPARPLVILLLAGAAWAQEPGQEPAPEPGLIGSDLVDPGELAVPARVGDAKAAHRAFLDAHEAHRKGDRDAALSGYLEFLGMPGHYQLPARYRRTVRARVEAMHERVKLKFTEALTIYHKDRLKGLVEMRLLAQSYPMLPEGRSARALVHSDTTRDAVRKARALAGQDKKKAAETLEKAIRNSPDSLFLYEAKRLLADLGGPNLLEPGERIDTGAGDGRDAPRGGDDEESVIEIGEAPPEPPGKKEPK